MERAGLIRMAAIQAHRGPDGRGVFVDEASGVGLAHSRLSIIDVSELGSQPMSDASGRRWIVFNGEIYNYLELREALAGYPFRSHTDTEVVLAAYDRWGTACLERFIGMFAFALWDSAAGTLLCARDRLGIKPFLYWRPDAHSLCFASEAKALLAVGLQPAPDLKAWADYLHLGLYDHDEHTFLEGVRQLPPGHLFVVRPGEEPRPRPYWSVLEAASQPLAVDEEEALDRLEELLADSVRLRLRSDVPLGLNFSGGLDSFTLMSLMQQASPRGQRLEAATMRFNEPAYDETRFTRRLVDVGRWHVLEVAVEAQEMPALLQAAMWHQEAPVGGVSTLAYHKLHQEVRSAGLVVQLEGQGVDELFGGYAYYGPIARGEQTPHEWLRSNAYQDATRFLATDVLEPRGPLPEPGGPTLEPPELADALNAALYIDLRHRKLPRVLRMNDRLSMASSIELREPFLDHRVVEFAFRLPGSLKLHGGLSKYLVRRLIRRRHPEAPLASEGKRAVVTPQREWLRGPLAPWVREVLAGPAIREGGFLDPAKAAGRFEDYFVNGADNSFFIWQWLNVASWFEWFGPQGAWRERIAALDHEAERARTLVLTAGGQAAESRAQRRPA